MSQVKEGRGTGQGRAGQGGGLNFLEVQQEVCNYRVLSVGLTAAIQSSSDRVNSVLLKALNFTSYFSHPPTPFPLQQQSTNFLIPVQREATVTSDWRMLELSGTRLARRVMQSHICIAAVQETSCRHTYFHPLLLLNPVLNLGSRDTANIQQYCIYYQHYTLPSSHTYTGLYPLCKHIHLYKTIVRNNIVSQCIPTELS